MYIAGVTQFYAIKNVKRYILMIIKTSFKHVYTFLNIPAIATVTVEAQYPRNMYAKIQAPSLYKNIYEQFFFIFLCILIVS